MLKKLAGRIVLSSLGLLRVQAIRDSGIEEMANLNKERVGLIIGSGIGIYQRLKNTP